MTTHTVTNRASRSALALAVSATVALATACPEPTPVLDAGDPDIEEEDLDAGSVDVADGGQVDCPSVTAFMEGDACVNEGQVCRSLLCIFPGPSCIELHCIDGVWSNPASVDDAGVVDAGEPPIRTVHAAPLQRGLPIDNHFVDPELTLVSLSAWQLYNASSTDFVRAERVISSELPLGHTAIRVRKSTNPAGVIALGTVRAPSGPSLVQIDVGRPADAGDVPSDVSLVGVYADGGAAQISLHPLEDPLVQGGVRWVRYAATLETPPIGFATLVVAETHDVDLLLSAPILVELDGGFSLHGLALHTIAGVRSPVKPHVAQALARAARENGDRLRPTQPSIARPLGPLPDLGVPSAPRR